MLEITKIADNQFQLAGAGKSLTLTQDQYEDLFYAVPEEADKYLNTTALYRLFTDSIFETDEERGVFLEILGEASTRDQVLKVLQDSIRKLQP